jgi:hypothetical protein
MLGALVGDGCYTDKKDGTVSFTNPATPELLSRMEEILQGIGLNVGHQTKRGKPHSITVISKNFRDWLLDLGLEYKKADEKRIPQLMFVAPLKCRGAFISGLIDTDGCVDKGRQQIRITSASERLLGDVQDILLSMGVISALNSQSCKHHILHVSGHDVFVLKKWLNLNCKNKQNRLMGFTAAKKTNWDVVPYSSHIAEEFFSLFKEYDKNSRGKRGRGLFCQGMLNISRCLRQVISHKARLSYPLIRRMSAELKKRNIPFPCLGEILRNNYFYAQIEKIEYGCIAECMQDIEVPRNPSFVINGFICHNSQGLEYPYVILPFINQFGRMLLQRNLIYTAITRAKEKVIVLGHGSAVEKAINNSSVAQRNTNLGERIKKCIQLKKKSSMRRSLGEQQDYPTEKKNMVPSLSSEIDLEFLPMGLIKN